MVLTDSLDLAPLLDIKTSRAEPFNGTDCQKRTQFTHIRPQKNNFAQIEHLHWAKLKYTPFLTLKGGVLQFGPVYLSKILPV